MVDGITSYNYNSYRNQWQNKVTEDTDETDETEETDKTQVWDAVFTDEKENGVSVDDFLNLMVAQLRNQDFMNPVDDTQYVTQLAQFASMQQMQEMATYMKTNYVMSLVGKNVTAAKFTVGGELQKETGAVERITLANNEFAIYVNKKKFTLEQIMEIHNGTVTPGDDPDAPDDSTEGNNPGSLEYLTSLIGKKVTVNRFDEDGEPLNQLAGYVEKISTADGKYQVFIDGEWYPLKDVVEVSEDDSSGVQMNGIHGGSTVTDPDDSGTQTPADPNAPVDGTDPTTPGGSDTENPENPGGEIVENPNGPGHSQTEGGDTGSTDVPNPDEVTQ